MKQKKSVLSLAPAGQEGSEKGCCPEQSLRCLQASDKVLDSEKGPKALEEGGPVPGSKAPRRVAARNKVCGPEQRSDSGNQLLPATSVGLK